MRSIPWDSVVTGIREDGYPIYDRTFGADDVTEVIETLMSYGVFMFDESSMQASAGDGMSVVIHPGKCHVRGRIAYESSMRELAFQASSSQDRIDSVVIRLDASIESRKVDLYVRQGVASETPRRPDLARNETVYELGICDVFIPAGSTSISQERITDTRLESARCGIVTPFDTIDTTTFYDQLQSAIDSRISYLESESERIVGEIERAGDAQIRELQAETDKAVKLSSELISETLVGGILDTIDTLAREHVIYRDVDDSSGGPVTDSAGDAITGNVAFCTRADCRKGF